MQTRGLHSRLQRFDHRVLLLTASLGVQSCAGDVGDADTAMGGSPQATTDGVDQGISLEEAKAATDALNAATEALNEATEALNEATDRANEAARNGGAGDGDSSSTVGNEAAQSGEDQSNSDTATDGQADTASGTAGETGQDQAAMSDQVDPNATTPDTPGSPEPAPGEPNADPASEPADAPSAVLDPLFADAQCTTDTFWRGGENAQMRPGEACVACHTEEREGPRFSIAGTVYATGHEPDDCNGASGSSNDSPVIVITDANGVETELRPNAVGNFSSERSIALPYTAKLVSAAGERPMLGPQTVGDCNACHTADGTDGAPGRITLPY